MRYLTNIVTCILLAWAHVALAAGKVTYETDVRPILREHCFACHNQDDATAGLSLDSFAGVTTGGAGGEVLAPGDPDGSRLWKLVTHQEEPKMPPGDKLPDEQLQVLRAWIAGGLLKDAGSKPLKSNKPAIAQLDATKLGKPEGEPAMPTELFHEPVLWTPRTGPIDALATSPWAPLAAIAWQRQISFYDTDTRELLGIVPYVEGVPRVVRFSRDGSLLLVAGGRHAAAGSATLFDVKTGARLVTLGDELDIVLAADVSADLSLVALGGPKKKVRVFRVADGSLAYQIDKHTDWITAVGFSPDGQLLATADRNGGAHLWQATAGHERADLRGHKSSITSLDWRADAAMLATASEDGTVRLWNSAGQQVKSVAAHNAGVLSVRFSKDGHWVTAGRDQKVKTWKSDGAAIADLGQLSGMALAAAFTHDGAKILASDYAGEVRLIDATSKQPVGNLSANPQPLGTRLAAADKELQRTQQLVQTSERRLQDHLSALEQGHAAIAAYEAKLATAQKSLAEAQAKYEPLAQVQARLQQTVETADHDVAQSAEDLATASEQLESARAADDANIDPEQLATLQQNVEQAEVTHATANQELLQAKQEMAAGEEKLTVAERDVESTAASLAQVSDSSAGLPDLGKLTVARDQAQSELAAAKQKMQVAEQEKANLAAQQARFAQANAKFDDEIQQRKFAQQELAEQTGAIETEHQQAATKLTDHRAQLSNIAAQLKAIQTKLSELQSTEQELKAAESQLAGRLKAVERNLDQSQQAIDLLEARKQDFQAAEKLRQTYRKKD